MITQSSRRISKRVKSSIVVSENFGLLLFLLMWAFVKGKKIFLSSKKSENSYESWNMKRGKSFQGSSQRNVLFCLRQQCKAKESRIENRKFEWGELSFWSLSSRETLCTMLERPFVRSREENLTNGIFIEKKNFWGTLGRVGVINYVCAKIHPHFLWIIKSLFDKANSLGP